ncbi:hypothetical protein HK097_006855 [Rhizophlyctis rosea]|uniref:Replication origin-binding protein n=1 Tax=Rhizophlyctis rosea TaxID=64517 RepID=A0AAD5X4Z7_9FUNG|nr:hypothetical protein HK097_006855 [Rhizophlyctis rosea]
MKCINQSKPEQSVQSYIEGDTTLSKHLILQDFDTNAVNIDTIDFGYKEEEIQIKGKNGKPITTTLDILAIPQRDLLIPADFDPLSATPLDKLAILPNPPCGSKDAHDHELLWQVMTWCKTVGITFDNFWAWLKKKDAAPEMYKGYMKHWKGKDYTIFPTLIDPLLQRYYPDINFSPSTQKFKQQFDFDNVTYVDGIDGKYLSHEHITPALRPSAKNVVAKPEANAYSKLIAHMNGDLKATANFLNRHSPGGQEPITVEYLRDLQSKPRAVRTNYKFGTPQVTIKRDKGIKHTILADPMGRNKTGSVVDFLKRYLKKNERVLWLTPRITLSNNTIHRLSKEGLSVVNYKDLTPAQRENGIMDKADFVICSIQSLHYLTKSFEYVVIDEPETLLNTFSDNCDTHRMIRKQDDHISRHYEIIKTKANPDPRQFLEFDDFTDWMTNILHSLELGEKLYIFTPFKGGQRGVEWITDKIKTFFGWEENKEVLAYYAEKEKEKAKLCNVETLWGDPKVRCVVTNSTISVGVNFDERNVFHKIFAHYSNMLPVRDFIQSLYRIRHPMSTEMILVRTRFHTHGKEKVLSISHPNCPIYQQLRKDIGIEQLANRNIDKWQTFDMLCGQANIIIKPAKVELAVAANKTYIEHLESEVELVFDWNRIADVSDRLELEQWLYRSYSNQATLDDRLEIEKYIFRTKFSETATEDHLGRVWQKKKDFVDKIRMLLEFDKHIVNRVLEENNVLLENGILPDAMVTSISIDVITSHFQFDKSIKNYKSGLVSQILNAFFGMKVYGIKPEGGGKRKRVIEDGQRKRRYVYSNTDNYTELISIVVPYCKEKASSREP